MKQSFALRAIAALLLAVLVDAQAFAQRPTPDAKPQLNFLAFGDWGSGSPDQKAVAVAMAAAAAKQQPPFDAALSLGDNFYVDLPQGAKSDVWKTMFEEMYPRAKMPFPFYIAVGNHDIESDEKLQAELDYPKLNP